MSLIPKKSASLLPNASGIALSSSAQPTLNSPTDTAARIISESRAQIQALVDSRDKSLDNRLASLSKTAVATLDPLQPLSTKKAEKPAKRPPAPPAVRQRSPPREQRPAGESWKIPAAISNWKNKSGNLVPLEDRVAASGGGVDRKLQSVNRKFLDFATELYQAETTARTEAERRREAEIVRDREQQEIRERELERLERETRGKTEDKNSDQFSAARRELLRETLREHRSQRNGNSDKQISDHVDKSDQIFDPRIFCRSAATSRGDHLYQRPLFAERQPLYSADRKRLADAKDQLDAVAQFRSQESTNLPVQFNTHADVHGNFSDSDSPPSAKRRRRDDEDNE